MKYRSYRLNVSEITEALNKINERQEKIISVLAINKYGTILIITLGQNDE